MDIENDFVDFGDVCRNKLDMQCQTGYYMLEGFHGYPKMKEGLRIIGNDWNYHSLKIHKDDVQKFIDRVNAMRAKYGLE